MIHPPTKEIAEIRAVLIKLLKDHIGPLKVTIDTPDNFQVTGTIPAMQGRQKVDGFYFSNIVPKPKDVRFYFFPAYTHPDHFTELSEDLQKARKGKSCFHIKYLTPEYEEEIRRVIALGIKLYQEDGLISAWEIRASRSLFEHYVSHTLEKQTHLL